MWVAGALRVELSADDTAALRFAFGGTPIRDGLISSYTSRPFGIRPVPWKRARAPREAKALPKYGEEPQRGQARIDAARCVRYLRCGAHGTPHNGPMNVRGFVLQATYRTVFDGERFAYLDLREKQPSNAQEALQREVIGHFDRVCEDYEARIRALGGIGFFLGGGDARSLTTRALLSYPAQTAATLARIYWQAAKLRAMGLRPRASGRAHWR